MSSQPFRSSALLAALLVGAAVLPLSLRAQQGVAVDRGSPAAPSTVVTSAPVVSADAVPVAGPRIAPAGITKPVQASPLGLAEPQEGAHIGAGSNLALMGVGAAGIVVGLLIGGNGGYMIALGGGVLGLVGLYRYLK